MRFASYLKLTKYWLKSRALSLSPSFYWDARKRLRGAWEKELAVVKALCRADGTAVDIGAHFGMYTHELLQCSARVEAFEPIPALVSVLRAGYRRNARVGVHAVALSDHEGHVVLRVPRAGWGRSTIEEGNPLEGRQDPSAPIDEVPVTMRTLDSYGLTNVTFIKIDVEGHEAAAMRGAWDTLERDHPALLVEIEDRHCNGQSADVRRMLEPLGYAVHQFDGTHVTRGAVEGTNNYLFLTDAHRARLASAGIGAR